jgi:NAD(P)-dependent dehydrogenase (short-subunit alcohol dehydrogenase family)
LLSWRPRCLSPDPDLEATVAVQAAVIVDLPALRLCVAEHRAERRRCACRTTTAGRFPEHVRAAACYGPFLLTNLLLDLLNKSAPARVVTVSSDRHTQQRTIPWDDLEPGHDCTYKASKLLNIVFTHELARRLTGTGVTANCLSPGFVRTELGREATGAFRVFLRLARPFRSSPEAGAQTSVYLATSPAVAEVSGRYFEKSTPAGPSALSQDPAAAKRLWQLSTQLSGLDADLPTTG